MADLSITVNGMKFENPFLLGSGPPGTNGKVIARSYDLGWGGMVCKTFSLDASKVINTAPRYAKLRGRTSEEVIGFQNIELISDRPYADWLDDLKQLKKNYPTKILIASIMEEYRKEAWQQIVREVQETGVDGFEMNLSCPHGLPERKMGMAMGENPDIVEEVCGWVKEVAKIPVWAKMTPNVGNPTVPAAAGTVGLPTFGVIFAHTGIFATSFTQPHTSSTMSGFSPIAMPILRSGKPCGQLRFISKPSTPVSWVSRTICC